MRIGCVTTSFPRFPGDYAGSFVYGLARALAGRGHQIEVIVPESSEPNAWHRDRDWANGVRVFGAPYVRPRRLQQLFFGAGVPDNLSQKRWVAGLIPAALFALGARTAQRARRWDAVISHWLLPSAFIANPARRRGTPHLAIAHSTDVHLLGRLPLNSLIAQSLLRSADHLGFVSNALREKFLYLLPSPALEHGRAHSSVTPMGIDLMEPVSAKPRAALRRDLGLEGFTVLFVGRLVPIKGVDVLIDAARGMNSLHVVIAGDGPEKDALKKYADQCGVDARFLGSVDAAKRTELLRACDAVSVPSRVLQDGRSEGLPLVLAEALGSSRPVIAAASGAVDELIENEVSGLIVPPDDASALRRALIRLQNDPGFVKSLSRAGQKRAQEREWSNLVPFYEKLIR